VRKDDRVEDDDLRRDHHVGPQDGDGGVQLSFLVEQRLAVNFGKWFVGIRIYWRA
jgi:hypothetical protein